MKRKLYYLYNFPIEQSISGEKGGACGIGCPGGRNFCPQPWPEFISATYAAIYI